MVLGTGGGAFMDPETRTLIRERATSVWLRADAELLLRRTSRRNNRPLLKRGDPHEILNRLIEERHPVYAQADLVVASVDGPPEITLPRVVDGLGRLHSLDPPRRLRSALQCTPRRTSPPPSASPATTSPPPPTPCPRPARCRHPPPD